MAVLQKPYCLCLCVCLTYIKNVTQTCNATVLTYAEFIGGQG